MGVLKLKGTQQFRRDTAAGWLISGAILDEGEPGLELDTGKIKIGDGVKTWSELSYFADVDSLNDTLSTVAKSGSYNDLTDKPSALDGVDGLSAYEVAVKNGFVGTESQWIASLKGADGIIGVDGLPGQKGEKGDSGKDGLTTSVNGISQIDGNITLSAANILCDSSENLQQVVSSLSTVAKSGSYNDLKDKPTNVNNSNILNGAAVGSVRTSGTKANGISYNGISYKLGEYAFAEGYLTQASGYRSHAEGSGSIASGYYSHAEGCNSEASGTKSHAEGGSWAEGDYSHAEGDSRAGGDYSHAEGMETSAGGDYSHAEGYKSGAYESYAHAGGYSTVAYLCQYAIGHHNLITTGGNTTSTTGSAFVIGNGTSYNSRSNCFRVQFDGQVFAKGAYSTSGADYAELFEWEDKNPDNEDRRGKFVSLVNGNKIKIAKPGENILGSISSTAAIIGNNQSEVWQGMYLRDVWGDILTEYKEIPAVTESIKHPAESYTDADGNEVIIREAYEQTIEIQPEYKGQVPIINPDYNPDEKYISRHERAEWGIVGLYGQLIIIDDGTCQVNGYCRCAEDGTATLSNNGFLVIERLDETHIRILANFLNNQHEIDVLKQNYSETLKQLRQEIEGLKNKDIV